MNAALIAALVAVLVCVINNWFSGRQSEKRLAADQDLAKTRADAELRLAERKAALDRQTRYLQRRAELAEAVLEAFYALEEAIYDSRAPFVSASEMQPLDGEDPQVATQAEYAVWRRLISHSEQFDKVITAQGRFCAVFGSEHRDLFVEPLRIRRQVQSAISSIISFKGQATGTPELRHIVFRGEDDEISRRMKDIVQNVEGVCRPAIEADALFGKSAAERISDLAR